MITKVYADNYKSLVNFEFSPGPVQLIFGENGSGKSSFFDVLRLIREVVVQGEPVSLLFPRESLTRWDTRDLQTFELTVDGNGGQYVYHLEIEQHRDSNETAKVVVETLDFHGQPLFSLKDGDIQLYRDDSFAGPKYPFDGYRSGIFNVPERHDYAKLTWFKDWLETLCCNIGDDEIDPTAIVDSPQPNLRLTNFASWYRHLIAEQPDSVEMFLAALRDGVVEGFESFQLLKDGGSSRSLNVFLKAGPEGGGKKKYRFSISELSSGQRALIKIYALAYCAMKPETTLIIDDPAIHIALAEIQPWLHTIFDRTGEIGSQLLLISHHPELINYLAQEKGVLFEREHNGPVRVKTIQFDNLPGLAPAEQVARGWVDA